MTANAPLGLFDGFGIEIEYMIVNKDSLDIMPIADKLLNNKTEVVAGGLCYSNELARHLIELKTNGPVKDLSLQPTIFNHHICEINKKLLLENACLLPTALHPWMNAKTEFCMWPHEYSEIYQTYHEIFDCCNHGWCNVQSTHLNLPFANDMEFARMHAAIRLILPLIPVIAASSPIVELALSGYMDTRLFFYNQNQHRVPLIAGKIVPDSFVSQKQYETELLAGIYRAIAPFDKANILQQEWLNSRGAIARFDRNTIEIRLLDAQESPLADLALMALLVATLKNMVSETWSGYFDQSKFSTDQLHEIYLSAIKSGSNTLITNREYLQLFAYKDDECTGQGLWRHILAEVDNSIFEIDRGFRSVLEFILTKGNLAERIVRRLGVGFSKEDVVLEYKKLANCLVDNRVYE